jgi:hypothetical protein
VNARRARGDRTEQHLRGRNGKIRSVMLAEADTVHADLVGKHGFFNHVPDHMSMAQRLAVGASLNVAEGIKTKFNWLRHQFVPSISV